MSAFPPLHDRTRQREQVALLSVSPLTYHEQSLYATEQWLEDTERECYDILATVESSIAFAERLVSGADDAPSQEQAQAPEQATAPGSGDGAAMSHPSAALRTRW